MRLMLAMLLTVACRIQAQIPSTPGILDPAFFIVAEQTAAENPITNGLLAFWKFNQPTNVAEPDLMTSDHSLTVSTGDTIPASAIINGDGRDWEDGEDDYMYGPTNRLTDIASDTSFTILAWANLESVGAQKVIARKGGTFSETVTSGNVLTWTVWSVATNRALTAGNLGTGTNYLLAVGHNATNDTLFAFIFEPAGVRSFSTSYTEGTTNTGASLYVGGSEANTALNWDGRMADMGIWGRSLSSNAISKIYNSGTGVAWPFTGITDP